MSFSWHGPRRVVMTAFTHDRRIVGQWDLDLTVGQQVPIPADAKSVRVEDPTTITRTRVELSTRPSVAGRRGWRHRRTSA